LGHRRRKAFWVPSSPPNVATLRSLAAGNPNPICIAYLTAGALGFLGSTNFAYGPETWNGQTDLLAQFFFVNVARSTSCNVRRAIHSRTQRSDKLVGHSVKAERLATSGILIMRNWKTTD
jgi:hypothetical protein